MPKSRLLCCIKGCNNTLANTKDSDPPVTFYRFPSAGVHRQWKKNIRNLWIRAVKKYSRYGEDWEPSSSSRICSRHFVENKKPDHPLSPSYVPTIFHGIKTRENVTSVRFQRYQRRLQAKNHLATTITRKTTIKDNQFEKMEEDLNLEVNPECSVITENKKYRDVECQKNSDEHGDIVKNVWFYGFTEKENGICTAQVQIISKIKSVKDKNIAISLPLNKKRKEVGCDPINPAIYQSKPEGFYGINSLKTNEDLIPLSGVTQLQFNYMLSLLPDCKTSKLSKKNKLLLFLMKLKLGISFSAIAPLFGICRATAHSIFVATLERCFIIFKNYITWPSKETVKAALPEAFKQHYPNTRVIIDCTEIKTEVSSDIKNQLLMYSSYKSSHTAKFLVGITPYGLITFISDCYGGRASDSFITVDSGLLNLLEPGDVVMADKGFPSMRTDVENRNAIFVMPPFLENDQFSPEQVDETYKIASVRVHVERVIERIKDFDILKKMPISLIPHIDKIVYVICAINNLRNFIIKESGKCLNAKS